MIEGKRNVNQLRIDANMHIKEKKFWLEKLSGEIMKSQIPYSIESSILLNKIENQDKSLGCFKYQFDDEDAKRILNLCNGSDNKVLMVLGTVLNILLRRYTSIEDVQIGVPLFKQPDSEKLLNKIVVVRNHVDDNASAKDLLLLTKNSIVDAFQNGNYPIEVLIEQLNLNSRNNLCPLFEIGLLLENLQDRSYFDDLGYSLIFSFNRNGETLDLKLFYLEGLYTESLIIRLAAHFNNILHEFLNDINKPVKDIEINTKEETHRILVDFNNNKKESVPENVISLIFQQIQKVPDNIALIQDDIRIKYSELSERINKVSNYLLAEGIKSGCLVGILCEENIETIINLLGVLKVGAGYLPIDPSYPKERIEYMVQDSGIELILTRDEIELSITNCRIVNTNTFPETDLERVNIEISQDNIAYVIYTSGSTGKPKGVLISHSNLASYVSAFNNEFKLNQNDVVLHQASLSFDISIEEIFPVLTKGGSIVVAKKEEILDQDRLSSLFLDNQISLISVSPLLLNEINKIPSNILKNIRICISGGDVLKKDYYDNLIKISDVYNTYGPTESTVCITYYKCDLDDGDDVPIGRPIQNYQVYLLDRNKNVVPIGSLGEICVSGPGVCRGYLNNVELTNERFIKNSFEKDGYIYQTGDLGAWSEKGDIYFKGRIDHQVKIRGYRVELGEIETQLLFHEDVKEVVVLDKEDNGGTKSLCAYYIPIDSGMNVKQSLKDFISERLPDHMVPSNFIKVDNIPLTINGKIDKKRLLGIEIEDEKYVAPKSKIEKKLASILSSELEKDYDDIGVNSDFFELGGHSLKAMILLSKIHRVFNAKISLEGFFNEPTIAGIIKLISKLPKEKHHEIKIAQKKEYYQLSSAQKRIFLLQQMDPKSNFYNIPYIMPLKGKVEQGKIQEIFEILIDRHESFRTSFNIVDEIPVQRILESVNFKIEYERVKQGEVELVENNFSQPFDLEKAPVLRVKLVDIEGSDSVLMIDMHHIISDAVSYHILENEFLELFSGKELIPLSLQYKDYSEWQNSIEQQEQIKDQENYWINRFKGQLPILNLPTDFIRPVIQSHDGAAVTITLSKEKTKNLKTIADEEGITIFMVLISIFNILLSKLSGQEDVIIGTPIAGRGHMDLSKIVGMFVNILAIRCGVSNNLTIKEYIKNIKKVIIEAFDNQEYQFEDLVEKISVERDPSRHPVFNVLFNLITIDEYSENFPEQNNEKYHHEKGISKYDLNFSAVDYGNQMRLSFEYCTKLFKPETIERFIAFTCQIIDQFTSSLDIKVSEIELLTQEDKDKLLIDFNETKRDYPFNKTIYDLFEEQVNQSGNEIAIKCGDRTLTYNKLEELTDKIFWMLQEKGVNSGDVIAIEQFRSVEMVISIFGILKAGCIYLPIDPDYPSDRKRYMLLDSNAKYLLTSRNIKFEKDDICERLYVEKISDFSSDKLSRKDVNIYSNNAYIIYTSGSTGKPKGVFVNHKSVINLLYSLQETYPINKNSSYLFKTSYCFDVSVVELFGWILGGGSMTILERFEEKKPDSILKAIKNQKVSHVNFVPSMFKIFSSILNESNKEDLSSLEYVFLAGEALNWGHIEDFNKLDLGIRIKNLYGPTEATVYASKYSVDLVNNQSLISIGKGIENTQLFVLDESLNLQLIGIPGELHISGGGLAAGYLNNPELTNEKFIDNPYSVGSKLYKTGDLVRWRMDGNIEFLGRIDHQVKVRGYRIELGEIEYHLQKHSEINESIVIAREDKDEKYLCAYIIKNDQSRINNEGDLNIRKYLASILPDYMIPSYFVILDEFPLTTNGKVNRKALPIPEVKAGDDYISPTNPIEEELAGIWSEVLKIPKEEISVNANFFELGGYSLLVMIMINKVHRSFGLKFDLNEIFRFPTIKSIADGIALLTDTDEEDANYEEVTL